MSHAEDKSGAWLREASEEGVATWGALLRERRGLRGRAQQGACQKRRRRRLRKQETPQVWKEGLANSERSDDSKGLEWTTECFQLVPAS